jgi:hypothetical protein
MADLEMAQGPKLYTVMMDADQPPLPYGELQFREFDVTVFVLETCTYVINLSGDFGRRCINLAHIIHDRDQL